MTMTWGKRRAIVIILVLIFLVGAMIWSASKPGLRIPSNFVLVMDASGQIEEQRAPDFFSTFNGTVPGLHDYIDALDQARTAPRITGLVVRIAPLATGWGKLEEIRAHLLKFRSSGKPTICYLGDAAIQKPENYIASA